MKDKKFVFWTSALTLLPMLVGLALWTRLPAELPTHWGADGQMDGWSGKGFAVFGMPALMLLAHWLMIGGMYLDRRNIGQNKKITRVLLMIFPALSNVMMAALYAIALGRELRISTVTMALMGLMFLGMGNYLPKCRRNSTLGIKIKWTLSNEENWNKTHRLGGKVFVLGGLVILCLSFVPDDSFLWILLAVLAGVILIPTVYSYLLYRRQVRDGTWTQSAIPVQPQSKAIGIAAIAAVLVLILGVCFTGNIDFSFGETALLIEADYWQDSTVTYELIDSVEFREEAVEGSREMGYGSPRLLMGAFRNEEFGYFTRYTYAGNGPCIVIRCGERILVLGAEDEAATRALYEALLTKLN